MALIGTLIFTIITMTILDCMKLNSLLSGSPGGAGMIKASKTLADHGFSVSFDQTVASINTPQ